jgi:effector-binding domain-containing protein
MLCLAALPALPLLIGLGARTRVTDALPKAETILIELETAIGDAASRAKAVNVVMKGTSSVDAMGGGTLEEVYVGADRAKNTISWMENWGSTQGTTGAWSWSTDPAVGVTIRDGDEQGSVKRLFGIARRAPWSTLYARAETVRKTDHEKRAHWEMRMFPKAGAPETWFVDCESHVLSRVDLELPNPQGGTIPMQFHFADFKRVDGILYPHVKKQVVGALVITSKYTSITHPAQVDEAAIAPPPEVVEAFTDPKRRATVVPEDVNAFKVETIEAKPAVAIRATIKANEVSKTLTTLLPEVGAYAARSGAAMTGPPFTRYYKLGGDEVEIEAGMPIAKAVAGNDRVKSAELPGGRTAIAWHVGSYHDLQKSYKRLEEWMKSQNLEPRAAPWEIYWTDPGIEPDPTKWRTQILWPVK